MYLMEFRGEINFHTDFLHLCTIWVYSSQSITRKFTQNQDKLKYMIKKLGTTNRTECFSISK